jgi:tyrosine-specific transport protein
MYKQIGAILLVAGTCIGSGMIALPMVLAKLGLIPSILLMMMIWFIMYYTALVNVELNLKAGHGLSLGALGRYFSGKTAECIGTTSLKILSYSLLAVFIYGGSSISQEFLLSKLGIEYSFTNIATYYALIATLLMLFPIKLIDYFNRFLFAILFFIILFLLADLIINITWSELPLFSQQYSQPSSWIALIPVVFTSFGFQVIFHTLSNYCEMNVKMLKRAFFWGSLIPAVVYIVWTWSILSVVYQDNPQFYSQMAAGGAEVGELIQVLSGIAKWPSLQLFIWCISLLAIITSVLGVGVGLCDSMKAMFFKKIAHAGLRNTFASLLTILPAYLVVIYVPNAFIAVLGFAGMILAVIAILLPVYLFWKIRAGKLFYPELGNNYLLQFSVAAAIAVIACELLLIFIK